jgi:hypothetical protein
MLLLDAMGIHGSSDPIRSTVLVGGSLIMLGMLALLATVIQHLRILKRLALPDFAYIAMRPINVAGLRVAVCHSLDFR